MKTIVRSLSAVAVAAMISLSATPSQAQNASQVCKAFNDFGATHGQCTSFFSGGNNTPVTVCKIIRDNFPAFFDANWKNLGQCVKDARHV